MKKTLKLILVTGVVAVIFLGAASIVSVQKRVNHPLKRLPKRMSRSE